MKKNFGFFIYEYEEVHQHKDPGLINYFLRQRGYNTYIITFSSDDNKIIPPNDRIVPIIYLRKGFWWKYFSKYLDGTYFYDNPKRKYLLYNLITLFDNFFLLLRIFLRTEYLMLFNLNLNWLLFALIYRCLKPKGKIYLKLDIETDVYFNNPADIENKFEFSKWNVVISLLHINLISCENKDFTFFLKKKFKKRIHNGLILEYIPNGVDISELQNYSLNYERKENIILHVARLGTRQKATEVILRAFSRLAASHPDWKLYLIGKGAENFQTLFDTEIKNSEYYNKQIFHVPFLKSREDLLNFYVLSKIIALPSRHESFGIAAAEAGLFQNVLLGSRLASFYEMTNQGRYGYLCPIDDLDCFTKTLKYMMENEQELKQKAQLFQSYIISNYNWKDIMDKLESTIQKL